MSVFPIGKIDDPTRRIWAIKEIGFATHRPVWVNFQLGKLTIRPAGYGRLKKLDLQHADLSHLIAYHYALKLDFHEWGGGTQGYICSPLWQSLQVFPTLFFDPGTQSTNEDIN